MNMENSTTETLSGSSMYNMENLVNLVTSSTPYSQNHSSQDASDVIRERITSGPYIDAANEKYFLDVLLPSFIYTCVLLVVGLPGNSIVVYVYGFKRKRSVSGTFILVLAVLDLINCVFSLTTELVLLRNYLRFDYPIICKLSRFITSTCNHSTTVVLLTIAVDRFRNIRYPLKEKMTICTARKVIGFSVFFGVMTGIPFLLMYGTRTIPLQQVKVNGSEYMFQAKTCLIEDGTLPVLQTIVLVVLSACHIVSDCTLVILYSFVGKAILYSDKSFRGRKPKSKAEPSLELGRRSTTRRSDGGDSTFSGNAGRTNYMLFMVTIVFMLSFLPYLVVAFVRNFQDPATSRKANVAQKAAYQLFLRSYFLNSTLNPIVYCFISRAFRQQALIGIERLMCRKREIQDRKPVGSVF